MEPLGGGGRGDPGNLLRANTAFVIKSRHYLPSFGLRCALMVQRHRWVNLLLPRRESGQGHRATLSPVLLAAARSREEEQGRFHFKPQAALWGRRDSSGASGVLDTAWRGGRRRRAAPREHLSDRPWESSRPLAPDLRLHPKEPPAAGQQLSGRDMRQAGLWLSRKRTKLTRHFKENNRRALLPMVSAELSSEHWNFGKLASGPVSSRRPGPRGPTSAGPWPLRPGEPPAARLSGARRPEAQAGPKDAPGGAGRAVVSLSRAAEPPRPPEKSPDGPPPSIPPPGIPVKTADHPVAGRKDSSYLL